MDNVKINSAFRGINTPNTGITGLDVTIKNSVISLIWGGTYAEDGTATSINYDLETNSVSSVTSGGSTVYARGINIYAKNSIFTLDNTTVQGFFYNINVPGQDCSGMNVIATNCTFKGRAAMNVWGTNGSYTFNDCTVVGINNFGGGQEGFACFVFNANGNVCAGNTLTINGGTVVSAVFNETGSTNPNANQFMVADRGKNNTTVINNAQYTCTKELGFQKGGLFEKVGAGSTATVNGGIYNCPEIIETNQGGGQVVINGGDFDVMVVSATAYYPEAYENYFDNVAGNLKINGGTFEIGWVDSEDGTSYNDDINSLRFYANNEKDPVSIINGNETYTNQNGTVSVVPAGTNANTSAADATKSEIEWHNTEDWYVPTAASNVVIASAQTVTLENNTVGEAYRMDMADGAKLVVEENTTLTIGKGGITLDNSGDVKPQVIVKKGATLVLNGLMYGSDVDNIVVEASTDGYGKLLIAPDVQAHGDNHPQGTVEFVAKSFYVNENDYQFVRFGIPTWTTLESIECKEGAENTGIYVFEGNGWKDLGYLKKGTAFTNVSSMNKPFAACNLIAYQADRNVASTYIMRGSLMGNSNAALNADKVWTPLANSYTADVDMITMLAGLEVNATNVEPTVYLATPAGLGTYTWDPVDSEWADGEKLAPMQAFILKNNGAEAEVNTIDYTTMVWEPGTGKTSAPVRRVAGVDNSAKMRIVVANENGVWDNVKMTENAVRTSESEKYMNDDVNIYVQSGNKLGILASNDLENTYLGFSSVKGGNFTISFANVEGREFTLVDMETGAEVAVEEGNTYSFKAAAKTSSDYRFRLVGRRNAATAIDNVESVKTAAGIYSITGQYIGEVNMWNALPAGVYVVDGVKRVK